MATTSTASTSAWKAPTWVASFYSKFPLVVLEQEDEPKWRQEARDPSASCSLWIAPPSSETSHEHYRSWASTSPSSLRAQLLFLLRDPPVRVKFQPWTNENAAPGGKLPALHVAEENMLIRSEDIRGWLDEKYPLKGKRKESQGLPSQEAYDKALAIAQMVLGDLLPAYLASLSVPPSHLHLLFPIPPALSAGLSTPLPASLTGDARKLDNEEILRRGSRALSALEELIGQSDWALSAAQPTPLDALIASHLYPLFALDNEATLRLEIMSRHRLGDYVERVLEFAGARVV